jgi:hypothetical protein
MIIEKNPPLRMFTGKGDTQPKKAYLIPVETIKKYAKKVVLRKDILQAPTLKYNGNN